MKNIDVALLNPPRQGLDKKVVVALNEQGPKGLVYVWCNPYALVPDLSLLEKTQPCSGLVSLINPNFR